MSDSSFRDDAKAPYEPVITGSVMVERVARAHYTRLIEWAASHSPGAPFMSWDELPGEQRQGQIAACRAAIKAMREPTEAMKAAGGSAAYFDDGWMGDELGPSRAETVLIAMIDAALAETAAGEASKARGQTEPPPTPRAT